MMRKGGLWVLAAVALLSFNCGFADRLDEMVDQIEEQVEEGEERDVLSEGVEAYIELRDAALDELANLVAATSESELQGQWDSIVDDMLDLPELDDLDDDLSSSAALSLYNRFVDEERAWWLALSQINPVAYRDNIVQHRLRLVNMTELLEQKWEELLGEDSQIDQEALAAIKALSETYIRTVQESRDRRERIRGYVNTLSDVAANDMVGSFIPGVLGDIVGMMAQTIRIYSDYNAAQDTAETELKVMAAEELKLLETFLATRKDTDHFVAENHFDKIKAAYAEVESGLRSFTGVGTSAQRRNAEDFANRIRGSLNQYLSGTETLFKTFVEKHWGKFYGPIAPETREALLETQVWLAEGEDAEKRGLDLQEDLRAWRDSAGNLFGADLSRDGVTEEEREFITDYLSGDLDALMETVEDTDFIQELTILFDRRGLEETLK